MLKRKIPIPLPAMTWTKKTPKITLPIIRPLSRLNVKHVKNKGKIVSAKADICMSRKN